MALERNINSEEFKTEAQLILEKHLELFNGIFENHREGVLIADLTGKIVYYNDSQSKIDGIRPKKALNKTICEVYNIASKCSPTMQVLRSGKPAFDDVHFYRTMSGNLINSACHIYPLFLENVFCGALSFISEYSFLEREALDPPEKTPMMAATKAHKLNRFKPKHKKQTYKFSNIIGKSPALQEAVKTAKLACDTPSPIMLIGETGVGKEMFARSIHSHSSRRNQAFTAINCAAIPETLLEGILFGTTKGAFTGAVDREGLLEATNGGIVFLDELDSIPLNLQSKLLRVLEEFTVRRVGDIKEYSIDIKIISAVGKTPQQGLEEGILRKDFYYRLGVVQVPIPPLRERLSDIPLLIQCFLRKHSASLNVNPPLINPEVMALFYSYSCPGNIRELEHAIEASLNILGDKAHLSLEHIKRVCPDIFTEQVQNLSKTGQFLHTNKMPLSVRCTSFSCKQEETANFEEQNFNGLSIDSFSPADSDQNEADFSKKIAHPQNSSEFYTEKDECFLRPESFCPANKPEADQRKEESYNFEKTEKKARQCLLKDTERFEIENISRALKKSSGNQSLAGRILGISPQLIYYKIKKYKINISDFIPRY